MSRMFISTHRADLRVLMLSVSVVISALASVRYSSAQTAAYTVVELPMTGQIPSRLNNLGDLVGRGAGSGQAQATFWSHGNMQARRLGSFRSGDYSSAASVNDAGEIVGLSNTSTSVVPFIWKLQGGMQRIPLLPGDNCGQGFSINKSGHVVGY